MMNPPSVPQNASTSPQKPILVHVGETLFLLGSPDKIRYATVGYPACLVSNPRVKGFVTSAHTFQGISPNVSDKILNQSREFIGKADLVDYDLDAAFVLLQPNVEMSLRIHRGDCLLGPSPLQAAAETPVSVYASSVNGGRLLDAKIITPSSSQTPCSKEQYMMECLECEHPKGGDSGGPVLFRDDSRRGMLLGIFKGNTPLNRLLCVREADLARSLGVQFDASARRDL